jgi:hypothetical protein
LWWQKEFLPWLGLKPKLQQQWKCWILATRAPQKYANYLRSR